MKPVSDDEMLAKIDEILEENQTPSESDTGVVRAAPTGPATPILPNQHFEIGMTTLQSPTAREFRPLPSTESDTVRYTPLPSQPNPFSPDNQERPLTLEELIKKLEQQTEASLHQEFCDKFTQMTGHSPDATISEMLKSRAFLEYHHGQRYLSFLQNPPVWSHSEGAQLDRLGELFEVAREAGETDAAYRERIRQRAFPHLT